MTQMAKCALWVLLFGIVISCKKDPELSPREEQEQKELTEVLLSNEILEQEGLRFILNYNQNDAQIAVTLDKSSGVSEGAVTLSQDQQYVNYSIITDALEENSDFVLTADFKTVTKNSSFDITVIGFTDLNHTKQFTITGITFTTTNQGTTRKVLKIHKGLNKYAFSAYN